LGIVYFANKESTSGGFYEKWSTSDDLDLQGPWPHYISNGIIIGSGHSWELIDGVYDHQNILFAVDLNGSVLWKVGVNTTFFPTRTPDVVHVPSFPIL
jgi:hypothetical protein